MSTAIAGIFYTILGTAICAIAQLTGKIATGYMPPVKMCAIRYSISIPMSYVAMIVVTRRWLPEMTVREIAMAVFIAIIAWGFGAILFFTTMQKDSMHRVAPVSNSLSIWAVILSILFLGEPFFPALAVVMLLLIFGTVFMTPVASTTKRWQWAIPSAMAVSILWAVSIILTKVTIGGVNYSEFVFFKMIAAAAFHVSLSPLSKEPVNPKGIKFIVISAAALVVGDTFLMAGVDLLPVSIFSPVFATVIPFGFLGSVFLIGEKPVRRNWIGMALIFLAAAICGYYGAG